MNESENNYPHYIKSIKGVKIDVYRVLDMYDVTHPAIGHAIKKLLCGGKRGTKNEITDYMEAIDSILRAIQMYNEDIGSENCVAVIESNTIRLKHQSLQPPFQIPPPQQPAQQLPKT